MLTADEIKCAAYAYALRCDEQPGRDLWFCPDVDLFVEAHRLCERGYLDRRRCGDDFVYRFSDQAVVAQELSNLLEAATTQEN